MLFGEASRGCAGIIIHGQIAPVEICCASFKRFVGDPLLIFVGLPQELIPDGFKETDGGRAATADNEAGIHLWGIFPFSLEEVVFSRFLDFVVEIL